MRIHRLPLGMMHVHHCNSVPRHLIIAASLALGLSCAEASTLTYSSEAGSTAVPDGVLVKLLPASTGTRTNYVLGTANGSSFTYSGTLPNAPVQAGTVMINISSVEKFEDQGDGYLGNFSPDSARTGSIDYATGQYSITLAGSEVNATVGVANGSQQTYTGTLTPPVRPGSVAFIADELRANDNGSGQLTRDGTTGTIDYSTGAFSVTFFYPPGKSTAPADVTVKYRNTPPIAGKPITTTFTYATGPGRDIANNISGNTLEAGWFGVTANSANNSTTARALQKAVGAAQRWAAAHPGAETILLLPAGEINIGTYQTRVNVRQGGFTLTGSGALDTVIVPYQSKASSPLFIARTASHVTLRNLCFDVASNHSDFGGSVESYANYLTVENCRFQDRDVVSIGEDYTAIVDNAMSWQPDPARPGSVIATLVLRDATFTLGDWMTDEGEQPVRGTVYGSDGTFKAFIGFRTVTGNTVEVHPKDPNYVDISAGDKIYIAEHFTRRGLQTSASHVVIRNNEFLSTQLRLADGDEALVEDVQVHDNQFINSQAYGISCVTRGRSYGAQQIRRDIDIHDNLFEGFQRAAIYFGHDWGSAQQSSCVLEDIAVYDNQIHITRNWEGSEVFRVTLGQDSRNMSWINNDIIFKGAPPLTDSCLKIIRCANGSLEEAIFADNTITADPAIAGDNPRFDSIAMLGGTRHLLFTGNTVEVAGYFYLQRGSENIFIENNTFTNARRFLRLENVSQVSIVGNQIISGNDWSDSLFLLRAENNWHGSTVVIANNDITPSTTYSGSLTTFDERTGGTIDDIALLDNNIVHGRTDRTLYTGPHAVQKTLAGNGRWTFDEYAGAVAADASGNRNDFTLFNAPTWEEGTSHTALGFDGATTYGTAGNGSTVDLTSNYTIAAWIYPVVPGQTRTIVSKAKHATWVQFNFSVHNHQLAFSQKYNGANNRFLGGVIADNQWQHVAVTVSATNQVKLYVNGVNVGTYQSVVSPVAVTNPLEIGRYGGNAPTDYFRGRIDDLQLHPRVLSDSEIQALAAAPSP